MTALTQRVPLQIIDRNYNMAAEGRRKSARLGDKHVLGEDKGNAAKRKMAYDEVDDGFAFTRTKAKKTKLDSNAAQRSQTAPQPQTGSRRTKHSIDYQDPPPNAATTKSTNSRRTRHSEESPDTTADTSSTIAIKKRRKAQAPEPNPLRTNPTSLHSHSALEITMDSKIALPFADTPIIRRNQEMRRGASDGSRRSSLGMRGRRASSLIDTGKSNALPHDQVLSDEFYKHIECEGLTEPRRMRQLLTWCGTRALGEKPAVTGEDGNAVLAAREIQSQLLKDFSAKSNLSDWFSRDDGPAPPSPPRPNPKNLLNLKKIRDLEEQLAQLKTEKAAWQDLLLPPSTSLTHPTTTTLLDTSLLEPLYESTLSTISNLSTDLAFTIDSFANNIHAISSYTHIAQQLGDEALRDVAQILADRDRRGGEKIMERNGGTSPRATLRALSRVDR